MLPFFPAELGKKQKKAMVGSPRRKKQKPSPRRKEINSAIEKYKKSRSRDRKSK